MEEEKRIKARLRGVKWRVLIMSGKGGVGKSFVTANLAAIYASRGLKVGVLDADIHGPSIPKILGLHGMNLTAGPAGIMPMKGTLGIEVVSMDFLLPNEETPVIWRGPLKTRAIRQFLADVVWGRLDILLVDLPPGTGDEPLSVAQSMGEVSGAVIVTIPSELSQLVVKKAISFAFKLKIKVLGVIENMSGFTCPKCNVTYKLFGEGGGEKVAREMKVPFLGSIPLDPRIAESCDKGYPFIIKYPNSPAAGALKDIAERILNGLGS